ncbi:MAG: hypothetical protein WB755_16180 [Terriglobales bacterium]
MRSLYGFWMILLLSGLAAAQEDWTPPGNYAEPFVPRLATPSASFGAVMTPTLSLDTPPLVVGARDATPGNVAGAGNATSSVVTTGQPVYYNQPLWYAPGVQPYEGMEEFTSPATPVSRPTPGGFEFGAATFQSSYGVAQLMKAQRKANRVYTNPDVARVNDNNGVVRYRGKTEQVN